MASRFSSGRCGGDSPCLAPQHSVRAGFAATVRPVDATDADALQMEGSGCVSTAFWRKQGFCGAGSGNLSVLEQTADACPPSGTPGILASFVSGNRVGTFSQLSHREQRELILRDLVTFWGPEAGSPLELVIKRWTEDPWQTGGYGVTRTPVHGQRSAHPGKTPMARSSSRD